MELQRLSSSESNEKSRMRQELKRVPRLGFRRIVYISTAVLINCRTTSVPQ